MVKQVSGESCTSLVSPMWKVFWEEGTIEEEGIEDGDRVKEEGGWKMQLNHTHYAFINVLNKRRNCCWLICPPKVCLNYMFAGLHTLTLFIWEFALTNGCVMCEHWTWHATFYPVLKMTKTNQGCVQRGGD